MHLLLPTETRKAEQQDKRYQDLQEVKILRNITSQYRRLYIYIDWLLSVLFACMKTCFYLKINLLDS